MASVKKFNGNLIIQTPVAGVTASNITLDTDDVYVTGNLTVYGNTTTVTSNNLVISDNVIVLNKGEPGAGVTKGNAGIVIDRGTLIPSQLQWTESVETWQVAGNSAVYANILTSTVGNVGMVNLFDDKAPVLGGNLNINGYAVFANTNANVMLNGNLQIISTISSAHATTIYANPPASGDTGLFVVNDSAVNEELVTKRRAFGFSLIL